MYQGSPDLNESESQKILNPEGMLQSFERNGSKFRSNNNTVL